MGANFSFISELQTIRSKKASLSERECELTSPQIKDTNLISEIYEKFKSVLLNMEPEPCADSPTQRKKFIFIILCFYAPSALAGGRLPHGLRDRIAEVAKTNPTFISRNIENVVFQFNNYKVFRSELNHLYEQIEAYLKDKELIK